MEKVHVCDMMLLRGVRHVDAGLTRKVERRLADLAACAPSLFRLSAGEVAWSVLAQQDGLVLRLDLVPRRQGLLFEPFRATEPAGGRLQDEADLVFAELQDAQVKVTRLAHAMAQGKAERLGPQGGLDALGSVIARHSSRKWHAIHGQRQVQIEFPAIPPFKVDSKSVSVTGTVVALARGWMRLERLDDSSSRLGLRGLEVCFDAAQDRQAASLTINAHLAADVRLHRCLFTHAVVGASLSRLHQ
jgi:hypothetical protein